MFAEPSVSEPRHIAGAHWLKWSQSERDLTYWLTWSNDNTLIDSINDELTHWFLDWLDGQMNEWMNEWTQGSVCQWKSADWRMKYFYQLPC